MPVEDVVQVPPAAAKQIRNFSLQILQPDGTLKSVDLQAVVLVDADTGNVINVSEHIANVERSMKLLERVVKGLSILTEEDLMENFGEDTEDA